LTKIAQLARVDPGIGMYAFGATILLIPAIMTNFDKRTLWQRVTWSNGRIPLPAPLGPSLTLPTR
jgi:paraquat-inducible protein A